MPDLRGAERTARVPSSRTRVSPTTPLLRLQQLIGNRAAGRYIQARLSVSQPGDGLEQEADRVAEQVMRTPDPAVSPAIRGRTAGVQRACATCDEEDERLDRKADGGTTGPEAPAPPDVDSLVANLMVGGQPLPNAIRTDFEWRLGHDFTDVRVHSDAAAAEAARAVDALAFTVGRDVVFGARQYQPGSDHGRRLLAHELTHVVQQGARSSTAGSATLFRQATATPAATPATGTTPAPATTPAPPATPAAGPQTLPDPNYLMLARRIHEAIHGGLFGWGTDEEQVYLALQQLRRAPAAIAELERVYAQQYRRNLEADIRDDFGDEELEYALQLMNRGTPGSPQLVGATPTTDADIERAARRLRAAVDIWGTDEEAVFAVLLPFRRDMPRLERLVVAYSRLYDGESLRERIDSEMSGSELDYALYLFGGPAVRANVEITEVTEAESRILFREMAALNFWTTSNAESPIPFHYPPDGCYARAHLMADRMTELGYASRKQFAVSHTVAGLRVETPLAADVRAPATPSDFGACGFLATGTQTAPAVRWWYHVAPIIRVRTAIGDVVEKIIDPSTATEPILVDAWLRQMNNEPFARLTTSEIDKLRTETRGSFHDPNRLNLTFSTDRRLYNLAGELREEDTMRGVMTVYAARAMVHELAAALRIEMAKATIDTNVVVGFIRGAAGDVRKFLVKCFPSLLGALRARLSSADVTRVDAELSRP